MLCVCSRAYMCAFSNFWVAPILVKSCSLFRSLPALTLMLLIIMLCFFFVLGKIKADDLLIDKHYLIHMRVCVRACERACMHACMHA